MREQWLLGEYVGGYAWFVGSHRNREAWALHYAAGIAWDQMMRLPLWGAGTDARECRALCSSRAGYLTTIKVAAALLSGLMPVHAQVTRALLERDLSGPDIEEMCRGVDLLDEA